MIETILTSLSLGLLASTSPCVFPLYPGFLAYLSGGQQNLGGKGKYLLGFFVLAGVLTMMLLLGAAIAVLSISVGQAISYVIPAADLLIILLGVLLLMNINPFKSLPQIQVPALKNPYMNAFAYGFLYGPIALPCSGPLVVSLFALSFTAAEFLSKLSIFLWYGLGFGLPLLFLSFLAGSNARWITRQFARHNRMVNLVGGFLLVGIGIYDLVINWELIRSFWL